MNQWALSSPDFKAAMDEVVFARYKAPMSHVRSEMAIAQAHVTDPVRGLSHEQRECLLQVLRGEVIPPK